jgi:hypothetical protein
VIPLRQILLGFLAVTVPTLFGIAVQSEFDAQKQSAPPHTRPADSGRTIGAFDAALPVEVIESQIFEAARVAAEEAERERLATQEAERLAAIERAGRPRVVAPGSQQAPVSVTGFPAECDNPVVPAATAWRESRCRWDAYNPTGCDGFGCTGYFQIHGGHYMSPGPWSGAPGACVGLDPWVVGDQIECASRLGRNAWGG